MIVTSDKIKTDEKAVSRYMAADLESIWYAIHKKIRYFNKSI